VCGNRKVHRSRTAGDALSDEYSLYTEEEIYKGDPLNPDMETVTPATVVAKLTGPQREQRVTNLVQQAHDIVDLAWEQNKDDRKLLASFVLFSGGNDSTVLAHMMRERSDYAVHCNTTIGIEATRRFVRETCQDWDLRLIEKLPPVSYRELVLERGFPGPAMHYKMYQRLKERQLEQVRRDFVQKPRKERIMFIAGRRKSESKRRQNIPLHERRGSVVWASPLAMWTTLDMTTYRLMQGDVPVNRVSELIHMSGECLCGSFAKENELEEIEMWFPEVAAEIRELEREVQAAGHQEPFCRWGHRSGGEPTKRVGMLCTSCDFKQDSLFDLPTASTATPA
jgi:3'-phosphoadenosine 5'-phosphosulfate sulfotransferase (PAPS reductase)/FAD synthetase